MNRERNFPQKSTSKLTIRPATATTALSRSNTTIKLKKREENIITENFKEIPALKMPIAIQTEYFLLRLIR